MAASFAPFEGCEEMPKPRVAMRRIAEVLRLKQAPGLSDAAISRGAGIARHSTPAQPSRNHRSEFEHPTPASAGPRRSRSTDTATAGFASSLGVNQLHVP